MERIDSELTDNCFMIIPKDVLISIIMLLSPQNFKCLAMSCKLWYHISQSYTELLQRMRALDRKCIASLKDKYMNLSDCDKFKLVFPLYWMKVFQYNINVNCDERTVIFTTFNILDKIFNICDKIKHKIENKYQFDEKIYKQSDIISFVPNNFLGEIHENILNTLFDVNIKKKINRDNIYTGIYIFTEKNNYINNINNSYNFSNDIIDYSLIKPLTFDKLYEIHNQNLDFDIIFFELSSDDHIRRTCVSVDFGWHEPDRYNILEYIINNYKILL